MQIDISKNLQSEASNLHLQINFTLPTHSMVRLKGESGAGKTTSLRLMSGLLQPDAGHILFDNDTWYDSSNKINRTVQQRSCGLLFQEYSLFPNMTVAQNIDFAQSADTPTSVITKYSKELDVLHYYREKPSSLSGGQRQRVALIQALAYNPKLLLLDEPFTAQDSHYTETMATIILDHWRQFGCTIIVVSHQSTILDAHFSNVYNLSNGQFLLS